MDPLIELFAQGLEVDPATLSEDTSPDNTPSWDSLAAMNLVTLIEQRFSVHLRTRDIMRMQTVALARAVLREKGVTEV